MRPSPIRALLVCALATTTLHAQSQFFSRSDLVVAYASVKGPDGRLVRDLKSDDFEIAENGSRREVAAFASGDAGPIAVAVLLESESIYARGGPLYWDLKTLIAGLQKDDLAGVSNLIGATRPVSTNREDLWNGIFINPQLILNPLSLWDGLDRSIGSLGQGAARRVVIVLSGDPESSDTPMFPLDGSDPVARPRPPRSIVSPNDVARRVQRDGVIVYSVSLAGFSADRSLKSLASESGGSAINLHRGEPVGKVFVDLIDEMHSLYLLGFVPDKFDGKEHRIQVRVRTTGSVVRARQTYTAPRSNRRISELMNHQFTNSPTR